MTAFDYTAYYRRVQELKKLQLPADAVRWTERYERPARSYEIVLYLGCNILRTPDIAADVVAGLLKGYKAATHWMSRDQLPHLGAIPVSSRIVVDGNRVTGGGVTAGIDFGLYVASLITNEQTARAIQLALEYNPKPPFNSGSPEEAGPELVSAVRQRAAAMLSTRLAATKRAADRLGLC